MAKKNENQAIRIDRYEGLGCTATVVRLADSAKLRFSFNSPVSTEALWSIRAELKANALRERTQPQINAAGGFCSHIRPDAATRTAKAVLGMASDSIRRQLHEAA